MNWNLLSFWRQQSCFFFWIESSLFLALNDNGFLLRKFENWNEFSTLCAGDGFHDNFEDADNFVMIYGNSNKKLATYNVSESDSCFLNSEFLCPNRD